MPTQESLQRAQEKHELISSRLQTARQEIEEQLESLAGVLDVSSADPHEQYAAALAALTNVIETCERSRDLMMAAARQEPHPIPIAKLAQATGQSMNTVRAKLPQIKQGRPDGISPF